MSEGTLRPYEPTLRERSTKSVANFLRDKMGMDNYRSYELARNIFGDSSADSFLGSIGAATFSPAEAIFGGQEGARQYKRADDLVGKGIGAATVGLSALEAFPATALMAKGIKRMFPKSGAAEEAVDVGRRKVSKGIAALPIAATGIAKVINDLPISTVAKVAKVAPKVTGSKLLDSLPFVKNELAPIFKGVLGDKSKPEKKLFQSIHQLNELKNRIKGFGELQYGKDGKAEILSDIGETRVRDYDLAGEETALGITDNILNDFIEKYPDMSIDDAIKMIDKEGYDMFVEAYKKGELDDSEFVNFVADYQGTILGEEHIDKVIKDNPDGTIDTIVYEIYGSDNIYEFMDPEFDIASTIGDEFFIPDEKVRRAFKSGEMSKADFEKYIADKEAAGEEIRMSVPYYVKNQRDN